MFIVMKNTKVIILNNKIFVFEKSIKKHNEMMFLNAIQIKRRRDY